MKHPKLVVGYLMNDELFVKSVPLSKSHDWLKSLGVEELTEFFAELLKLVTQISEEKENSETLEVFLDLWREAGLAKENEAPFWESLRDSLEATFKQRDLVDIAEAEQELDAPWIDIIEVQQEQDSTPHKTYTEPVHVIDVTERQRDHYLASPIFGLPFSPRIHTCLERENVETVRDLVTKTEEELLEYKNFGMASLHEVKERLAYMGLSLGMDLDDEDYDEEDRV